MIPNTNSYKIILLGSDYLAPKLGGSAKIIKSYVDHYQRNNCTIGFWAFIQCISTKDFSSHTYF